MIHMEVDLHSSPSFRGMRSYSTKRARSPEDASPSMRPSKRLSLAIGESVPSPVFPPSGHRHLSANSANSSRHPSEDWVKQAGGLSIESPLPTGYSPIPSPVEDAKDHQGPMDEDMNMDADDFNTAPNLKPNLPLLQTSCLTPSYSQAQGSYNPGHHQSVPQYTEHGQQATLSVQGYSSSPNDSTKPYAPTINVLPPTPIPPPRSGSYHITRPSTPTDSSPMAMALSPAPSFTCVTSPRKQQQRFTMGPRADCEKCRLGVKGHWVHLD